MSTTNILDLNNRLDKIEKSGSGGGSAAETSYSNTTSGLTATNVQTAIDEIDGVTDNLSSAITDIEGDIDNLEEDVTKLGGDTDWIQIGTGDTYYRKVGKIVFVRTDVPAEATGDWVTIDTLPEGFRPISSMVFCPYSFSSNAIVCRIQSTGEIQYVNVGTSATPIYTSFIADN